MGKRRKRQDNKSGGGGRKSGGGAPRRTSLVTVSNVVAANVNETVDLINNGNPNPKRIGLYSNGQTILLVGEGDFSFAAMLATALGGERICATSYDSRSVVHSKYGTAAEASLNILKRTGARVYHSVDATNLFESLSEQMGVSCTAMFDIAVFNFPHCGGSTHEDVLANQHLIRSFFDSAKPALVGKASQLHVTLRDTVFYNGWNVKGLAQEVGGLHFVKEAAFDSEAYHNLGYREVRTNPAARESPPTEKAKTSVWKSTKSASKPRASLPAVKESRPRDHTQPPRKKTKTAQQKAPKANQQKASKATRDEQPPNGEGPTEPNSKDMDSNTNDASSLSTFEYNPPKAQSNKLVRALRKKLRQVELIKALQLRGEKLKPDQQAKLSREATLRKELAVALD